MQIAAGPGPLRRPGAGESRAVHVHFVFVRQGRSMLTRPRFKPHLRLAVVPDEGVFVLSGARQVLLLGRLYSLVAPLMDGKTPDEICRQLSDEVSTAEVFFTLRQLEKKGFLAES